MARRRKKFNSEYKQAAEIVGNLSVAWFSAGVIVPLLGRITDLSVFFPKVALSFGLSGFFFWFSLELAKRGKK